MLDACTAVVLERSRQGPVVLVVEDLQWADAGTLAVLGEVLESGHTGSPRVLVTLRGGPRSRGLDRLLALLVPGLAVHLPLAGLPTADVEALVTELVGRRQGPRLEEHVQGVAGNPLFVVELLDALAEQGSLVTMRPERGLSVEVEHSTLPPSLHLTMLRRLSTLPVPALEALRVAALLGAVFTVEDLGAILEEPPLRALQLLREPIRAGWIESSGPGLTFRHDLVREALLTDTPEGVRRTLHRQAARRLSAVGRDASEVASHLLRGADPPDPSAAAHLWEAGRRAISRDPAIAAEFLEGAARLDPDGPDRDAVDLDRGRARVWAGRFAEGEATLRALLERPHDPGLTAEVGLALARSCLLTGATQEAVEVLEDVSDRNVDEVQRARMDAQRALAHVYRGELVEAESAADAVLAHEAGWHDEARCLAGGVRASLLAIGGHMTRAVEQAEEAVAIALASADRETSRVPPQLFLGSVLIDCDRFDEGRRQLGIARAVSEGLGTVWVEPVQHLISARAHLFSGELDDAEAESETALRLSEEVGVHVMEAWGHAMISHVRLHRSELMGTPSARAAALHCRGLVEDDVEALRAAAVATRPIACRPEHAAHCLDAGRALGRRGAREEARALLDEARAAADACGMHRAVREAEAELRDLGFPRGVRGSRPRSRPAWGREALTPTEATVAKLAAEGLSNPAIGERLFVSRRTVQTHLSHVYAKLGISSRVELATRFAREAGPV